MSSKKTPVDESTTSRTIPLYSDECIQILQQACKSLSHISLNAVVTTSAPGTTAMVRQSRMMMPPTLMSRYADNSSSASENDNDEIDDGIDANASQSRIRVHGSDDDSAADEEGSIRTDSETEQTRTVTPTMSPYLPDNDRRAANDSNRPVNKKKPKFRIDPRQRAMLIRKHIHSLSTVPISIVTDVPSTADDALPTHPTPSSLSAGNHRTAELTFALHLPLALLSRDDRLDLIRNSPESGHALMVSPTAVQSFLTLARALCGGTDHETSTSNGDSIIHVTADPLVIILHLRSGRFAAVVYTYGKRDQQRASQLVDHRTATRYTIRKKQGKAQSAQDGQRKAQSMGAQLRRAGAVALQQDIAAVLADWHLQGFWQRAALILVSCPKTMRNDLYGDGTVLSRDDSRVRKIPLAIDRPSFENCTLIHEILIETMTIRLATDSADGDVNCLESNPDNLAPVSKTTKNSPALGTQQLAALVLRDKGIGLDDIVVPATPLSPWHEAARYGNVAALRALMDLYEQQPSEDVHDIINHPAGDDFMTPLHYAAAVGSTSTDLDLSNDRDVAIASSKYNDAAECIRLLLLIGRVDPCRVDGRHRVAYFLACHDRIRDAFRMCRSILGEEYCDWDRGAKVGPPLTIDDVEDKKQKDLEKKRKKKARQKAKKTEEKAEEAAAVLEREKLAADTQAAESAARARAGLAPKTNPNACDFCQKPLKSQRSGQVYTRLEYKYCSSECVQNHKRELMATAALRRFGSN